MGHLSRTHHVVAAEGLHDRGLVQKLDSLPQVGRFVHCLYGYVRFPFSFNDVFSDAFVDHAEGALAELPQNGDLVSGNLPFIFLVHCRHICKSVLS